MKTWKTPEITELNINETAYNWFGNSKDGGYIGDGVISGHLKWDCSDKPGSGTDEPAKPEIPTDSLS